MTHLGITNIDRIACGGVGAIILESSFVRGDGKGFDHQLGLHTDDVILRQKQLAEVAHAPSVVIGPQIFHAGRQTKSKVTGSQPIASSPIPDPTTNEGPRALRSEEIPKIVNVFAKAARRAVQAECDLVEIHGVRG